MLLIFTLIATLFAQCPLQKTSLKEISLIDTTTIPNLIEQGKGCITLVELWASWCGTCQHTKPKILSIVKQYPTIAYLPISADYRRGPLKKYLKHHNMSEGHYLLNRWTLAGLAEAFQQKDAQFQDAIPLLLLYDQHGTLLYQATEPKDLSSLRQKIQKLIQP